MPEPTEEPPALQRVDTGIYKRPSGRYVVPVWNPLTKKREWANPAVPCGGFDTLKEARAYKLRRETAKPRSGGETCDSFARRWPRDMPRPSQTTNQHNAERVRAFAEDFRGVPLSDVTRPMARLWINGGVVPAQLTKIAKRWQGATIEDGQLRVPSNRGNLQAVRAMFSDAVRDDLAARNPFAQLGLPQGRGRRDLIVLTDSELALLVRCAESVWDEFGSSMLAPLIIVAAGTGLRPGELYGLRWPAVDYGAGEIHVLRQRQSRTGEDVLPGRRVRRQRTVVMPEEVADALRRIPRRADDDHVFWGQRGEPLCSATFGGYWRPLRAAFLAQLSETRRAEVGKRLTLYCLRHAYATHLAGLPGVTADVVADQLGHNDGGELALRRYVHRRSEEARDRVREAMRRPPAGRGQIGGGRGV